MTNLDAEPLLPHFSPVKLVKIWGFYDGVTSGLVKYQQTWYSIILATDITVSEPRQYFIFEGSLDTNRPFNEAIAWCMEDDFEYETQGLWD